MQPDVREIGDPATGEQAEDKPERDAGDQHCRTWRSFTPASCGTGQRACSGNAVWEALG